MVSTLQRVPSALPKTRQQPSNRGQGSIVNPASVPQLTTDHGQTTHLDCQRTTVRAHDWETHLRTPCRHPSFSFLPATVAHRTRPVNKSTQLIVQQSSRLKPPPRR